MTVFFSTTGRIAVLIPDKTRHCPSDKVLNIIIRRLIGKGIRRENITVILARGFHSGHTSDKIKCLVGAQSYSDLKVIDHDAGNNENTYVGFTSMVTRVSVN